MILEERLKGQWDAILNNVLLVASGHLSHTFGIPWLYYLSEWAEDLAKPGTWAASFCYVSAASLKHGGQSGAFSGLKRATVH